MLGGWAGGVRGKEKVSQKKVRPEREGFIRSMKRNYLWEEEKFEGDDPQTLRPLLRTQPDQRAPGRKGTSKRNKEERRYSTEDLHI